MGSPKLWFPVFSLKQKSFCFIKMSAECTLFLLFWEFLSFLQISLKICRKVSWFLLIFSFFRPFLLVLFCEIGLSLWNNFVLSSFSLKWRNFFGRLELGLHLLIGSIAVTDTRGYCRSAFWRHHECLCFYFSAIGLCPTSAWILCRRFCCLCFEDYGSTDGSSQASAPASEQPVWAIYLGSPNGVQGYHRLFQETLCRTRSNVVVERKWGFCGQMLSHSGHELCHQRLLQNGIHEEYRHEKELRAIHYW